MNEHRVSYEVAKLLREKGFNLLVNHFYSQSGKLFPRTIESGYEPMTFEADDFYENFNTITRYEVEGKYQNVFSAPTLHQMVDWLREEKDIQIKIVWNKFYPDTPYEYEVRPTWRDEPVRPYGMGGMQSTYYKSLERAINEALKMIDKKEFKKGGDLKDNSKNKNMSTENEFIEIADYGDQMYFTRDFGQVIVGDDEKEIPLVLVAKIENFYEATGEDEFEEKPFAISLNIYPSIELIDKQHIDSVAESAGINMDEVGYTDLDSYGLGIPLILKDAEEFYSEMSEAEDFLKSKEFQDQLSARQITIGWYMDNAINRAGQSRWEYLEYVLSKDKGFY